MIAITCKLPNENLNVNDNQSADDVQTASEDHSLAESKCNKPHTYAVVDFKKKKKANRDTERISTTESGHISDEGTPPHIPLQVLLYWNVKGSSRITGSGHNREVVALYR